MISSTLCWFVQVQVQVRQRFLSRGLRFVHSYFSRGDVLICEQSHSVLRLLPHLAYGGRRFLVRRIAFVGVDRVSGQPLYGRAGPCASCLRRFWRPL